MAHHHNTSSVDAYFRQGNSLYEMELYEEAIDAYTSAIRFNPDSIIAFYNRGLAKVKLGRYADAIQDFDIAIRRKPDLAEAYTSTADMPKPNSANTPMLYKTLTQRHVSIPMIPKSLS